jgi:hypothetical protein
MCLSLTISLCAYVRELIGVLLSVCCQVDANEQLLAGRLNRTALTLLSSRDPLAPAAPLSPQQQQQQQQQCKQRRRSSSGSAGDHHSEQQHADTAPASEEDPWLLPASTTASGTTATATAATAAATLHAAHAAARTAARSPPRMTASASTRALAAPTPRTPAAASAPVTQHNDSRSARSEAKQRPASAPHRRVKHPAGGASPPRTMSRVASHRTVGVTVGAAVGSAAADQLNEYIAEMERLTCDAKAALSALRCEGGGGGVSAALTIQRYWRYTNIYLLTTNMKHVH